MKPGDLLEWDDDALRAGDYTLDEGDAVSPFTIVEVDEHQERFIRGEVRLLDSRGRLLNYDMMLLKELTRRLG